jgi:5-methylthioribose kinase
VPNDFPLLRLENQESIVRKLRELDWIGAGESVHGITPAGEGNMNLVVRVRTSRRTLIVKQSRPWVEKYPHIAAPPDRIFSEVAFYRAIESHRVLAEGMPQLVAFDETTRTALFEDLGDVQDFTSLYEEPVEADVFSGLTRWLSTLHRTIFPAAFAEALRNREMRSLNHAHLFVIPLDPENGLDLDAITPGLAEIAATLRRHAPYVQALSRLGRAYLEDGEALLHGDFYPGSWVRSERGAKVIDPEFAYFGRSEYDVGVFRAHLILAGYGDEFVNKVLDSYEPSPGFDHGLVGGFAGMEIMRRLIGVAQLPLNRSLADKRLLLERSVDLVLGR